jgi:hypothetical protein
MTDRLIKEQVKTIEKATKEATQSKEKALKFLLDAGIIEKKNGHSHSASQDNTNKKK